MSLIMTDDALKSLVASLAITQQKTNSQRKINR